LENDGDACEAAGADGVTGAASIGLGGIDPEQGGNRWFDYPRDAGDFDSVKWGHVKWGQCANLDKMPP
jgi:hypothetical protein